MVLFATDSAPSVSRTNPILRISLPGSGSPDTMGCKRGLCSHSWSETTFPSVSRCSVSPHESFTSPLHKFLHFFAPLSNVSGGICCSLDSFPHLIWSIPEEDFSEKWVLYSRYSDFCVLRTWRARLSLILGKHWKSERMDRTAEKGGSGGRREGCSLRRPLTPPLTTAGRDFRSSLPI